MGYYTSSVELVTKNKGLKMKKYLQMIGWINYRGRVDYKEIAVDLIIAMAIVIAITYLAHKV